MTRKPTLVVEERLLLVPELLKDPGREVAEDDFSLTFNNSKHKYDTFTYVGLLYTETVLQCLSFNSKKPHSSVSFNLITCFHISILKL